MASGEEKMRVAVMGATGSGKSTFINVASGSNLTVSSSLESCTIDVETATFFLDGRTVTLIDTPGFDDTTRNDTDVLESITDYLADSYSQGAKLAGVIYMHDITKNKMSGPSRKNFHMLRNLCGDTNLRNVLLVTNMWSSVDPDVGEARERELRSNEKFFKPALDKKAQMLRHDGSRASAHAILRQLVGLAPTTLLVQDEMVNQEKDLAHTTAGAEVIRELKEQTGRHAKALEQLFLGMEAARFAEDEETWEILQEEAHKTRENMERIRGDLERMVTDFAIENSRLENENRRYKRDLKKQKADAEHRKELYERERRARELAEAGRRQAEAQLAAEHESQEREKKERERQENERQVQERREREKQEREKREQERREREKQEQEKQERAKQEREKQEHERREREKQEHERREREKQERERREHERQERAKQEQQKQEREERRKERERQEKEKNSGSGCLIQ